MFSDIFTLIIDTFFSLFMLVLFLRFLFPLIRVDYYNPFSQFVVKVTDPVLVPIRKVLPIRKSIDSAALLFIVFLQIIEICLLQLVHVGAISSTLDIIQISVIKLVHVGFSFFLFAIIGQIILSWFAPHNNNPAVGILFQITEPILAPARRLIPPVGGLDFSPILVLLAIEILDRLLTRGLLPEIFYLIRSLLA